MTKNKTKVYELCRKWHGTIPTVILSEGVAVVEISPCYITLPRRSFDCAQDDTALPLVVVGNQTVFAGGDKPLPYHIVILIRRGGGSSPPVDQSHFLILPGATSRVSKFYQGGPSTTLRTTRIVWENLVVKPCLWSWLVVKPCLCHERLY